MVVVTRRVDDCLVVVMGTVVTGRTVVRAAFWSICKYATRIHTLINS